MGEQDIKDFIEMIGTRPGVDLQQLFYQPNPTIYNADKSAEEELNDLIRDYEVYPEGSLEKEL